MTARELGNGLLLRRSTQADTEAMASFYANVMRDPGVTTPDIGIAAWVRDLMSGRHPSFAVDDFTLVIDSKRQVIVSALCLIGQRWTYAGVPFDVGRIELVGTHPDYRNRGLVRLQFDEVHRWSEERGQVAQVITGIPFFYRQFGYEMAVELGGSRSGYAAQVPSLAAGEGEPYRIRLATIEDLPAIARLYRRFCDRSLLACVRDESVWGYELQGREAANTNRREIRMIESSAGETVGLLLHPHGLLHRMQAATMVESVAGVSWLEMAPSVVRYLLATGREFARRDGQELAGFSLMLGGQHPMYQAVADWLPATRSPYAWYIRVPDLRGFLGRIMPAIEANLAQSLASGHTGDLRISFFRSGIHLVIEHGRLVLIEPWQPTPDSWGHARFPGLAFLQLLFGYRTVEELRYAFPDCWTDSQQTTLLLNALFPKHRSSVWPVD